MQGFVPGGGIVSRKAREQIAEAHSFDAFDNLAKLVEAGRQRRRTGGKRREMPGQGSQRHRQATVASLEPDDTASEAVGQSLLRITAPAHKVDSEIEVADGAVARLCCVVLEPQGSLLVPNRLRRTTEFVLQVGERAQHFSQPFSVRCFFESLTALQQQSADILIAPEAQLR